MEQQKIKKLLTKILEDTISYYQNRNNLRGLDDKGTPYYYIDEKRCAIGRLLTPEGAKKLQKSFEFFYLEGYYMSFNIDELFCYDEDVDIFVENLIKEYKEIKDIIPIYREFPTFLRQIQKLHDFDFYWTSEQRLTNKGQEFVKEIKNQFSL